MKVPPKIKTFIWRAIKNSLIVKENLASRGVKLDSTCCICKLNVESQEHMFFWCAYANLVWFAGPSYYKPNLVGFSSFPQWWNDIVENFWTEPYILDMIALTCWYIWKARCKVVFEKELSGLQHIIFKN
uniref:Reverse transcriptase zinc-binding domain-containing protein n=1 Tax=Manihot esculenta TaxID=3983 RepID=A0A2C9U2Y2_MANES